MTWAGWTVPGPGLATGGSDCSIGPFGVDEPGGDEMGAAEFGAGARVWAGPAGTEGTSFGGRSAPSKDCAPAAAGGPHAACKEWPAGGGGQAREPHADSQKELGGGARPGPRDPHGVNVST